MCVDVYLLKRTDVFDTPVSNMGIYMGENRKKVVLEVNEFFFRKHAHEIGLVRFVRIRGVEKKLKKDAFWTKI